MRHSFRVVLALAALLVVSACSGSGDSSSGTQSPTAPSNPTTPPGGGGGGGSTATATINGMVTSPAGSTASASSAIATSGGALTGAGATTSGTTLGLSVATVQVVGANVSAPVDGAFRFTLTGVPVGAVQLRFTGPGTDVVVPVGTLASGQTVLIVVEISGSRGSVVSDSRQPGAQVPINGTIVGLGGTPGGFEFTIDGRIIRGDAATQFFGDGNRNDSFVNLRDGARVEVKTEARAGFFYATRIHINGSQGNGNGSGNGGGNGNGNNGNGNGNGK